MSKVMIVEDDDSLREIYGIRLTAEGYAVVSARDGEEALAVAVKERPDLIVSDVMMPKISGFDMLDILRSTPETRNVKVIMMTALSSEDQRERGESLGADRYLVKSQVGIEDVVNAVHEVLGDRSVSGVINPATPVNPATQAVVPGMPTATPTAPATNAAVPGAAAVPGTPVAQPVPNSNVIPTTPTVQVPNVSPTSATMPGVNSAVPPSANQAMPGSNVAAPKIATAVNTTVPKQVINVTPTQNTPAAGVSGQAPAATSIGNPGSAIPVSAAQSNPAPVNTATQLNTAQASVAAQTNPAIANTAASNSAPIISNTANINTGQNTPSNIPNQASVNAPAAMQSQNGVLGTPESA